VTWADFSRALAELGYDVVGYGEPEPGSVIGFDANARGQFLTTDADLPDDFVDPIAAWLASEDKVGPCIAISCINCGKSVIKAPEWVGIPVKCYDCQAEPLAKRVPREVALWLLVLMIVPAWFLPYIFFEVTSTFINILWFFIVIAVVGWVGRRLEAILR
jgi:hypothetical protein